MRHVSIEDQGRSGSVIYHEAGNRLACYWEYGGGNVVAFVQCGKAADWAPRAAEARWVFRLTTLRMYLGLIVLAGALLVGAGLWVKSALLAIDPGKGTALGYSVRTDRHVATLIQTLEPYVPSLNRNHGNDRYRVSLFLVPLDGSDPWLIPLRSGLAPDGFGLAKVLVSDGRTLWFNVAGIGGVDLDDYELRTEAEIAAVDPRSLPRPGGDWPLPPEPERFLEHVASGESDYLDAALLRPGHPSAPIRLDDPPGALMLHTSMPGPQGTAVVARVDETAKEMLWSVDTGIGRFALQQILPGDKLTAFVGTRPAVPGKVSEPLLVIVEHKSGKLAAYSLWQ